MSAFGKKRTSDRNFELKRMILCLTVASFALQYQFRVYHRFQLLNEVRETRKLTNAS
jgi:hypothetical protein